MSDIKCPIDPQKKYHVIPTNNWLIPVKKYEVEDSNEDGLLMISKLYYEDKIIVKITQNIDIKVITFNNLLKNEQNFVYTYCSLICEENKYNYKSEYKNVSGYCQKDIKSNNNQFVTLEIMKKYKSQSLASKEGTIDYFTYVKILRQLIIILIYIYDKYGFLHLDLHLGNILYKTYTKNITLEYTIKNNRHSDDIINISLNTDFKLIILDYNNCISYNPNIYIKYDPEFLTLKKTHNGTNRLFSKIVQVFEESTKLLEPNNERIMLNKLKEYTNSIEFINLNFTSKKHLRNYYLKRYNYEQFLYRDITASTILAETLFSIVTNNTESIAKEFD